MESKMMDWTSTKTHNYDYDLFVIGGGSGGLSTGRAAAELGAKVAVADFVKPTPKGATWGLGGTCVNVGCIPKKMMHYAATLADARKDMKEQGWKIDDAEKPDWNKMVETIQSEIMSLNWGYKMDLMKQKCKYYNSFASFVDPHTIKLVNAKNEEETVTADKIVISCGGRPSYPDIPGAKELGITSDDLFSLQQAPGKTLVVGASYVALECAGFLTALGYDTTVMVRSILLRGFDQDMANLIGEFMEAHHTKFIRESTPSKLEKEGEQIKVTWNTKDGEKSDVFDTVLFAIGRYATTKELNLDAAGLKTESNGKFIVTDEDKTNVDNIYAIGDVQHGKLELTPSAIKAGNLLARRLFAGGSELMDYDLVPTTVFTPIEYGTVGLTEVDAKAKYGAENIDTYHTKFKPLEWSFHKFDAVAETERCYVKVLVNKADKNKVVGFHICSPNAGEITQGVGIGFKCGMTFE